MRLVAIVGPTGAGKSDLALALAEVLGGEVVNCDSLQLYRGFDIGTAKTPETQRRGIPHHLLDVLEPHQTYSAGDYARSARDVIAAITARGRLPIVVGGTGFYLRALLGGLPSLPGRDDALRARLARKEQRRAGSLHRLLSRLEPAAGARIHVRDVQKLTRALEIRILTGRPMPPADTALSLTGYQTLLIGLQPDRALLLQAIEARTRAMFDQGLLAEVGGLLSRGCTGQEKPFESLGYKQALEHLRNEITLEQAVESTIIQTRQYAKRQLTWFRSDPRVHWIESFGSHKAVLEQSMALVQALASAL